MAKVELSGRSSAFWHWFSIKHGDRYLNEIAARWNWRGMDNMDRFDIALRGLFEPALPWKALTA